MPSAPRLVLVDPRTQQRARLRDRLLAVAIGGAIAAASAAPLVLSLAH